MSIIFRNSVDRKVTLHKRMMTLVIGLICLSIPMLQAQNPSLPEYKLKAVFLFNFTQFVGWPADAFNSNDAPFVIGILGNDPFGSYIDDAVAGEKMQSHPLVVNRYHDIKEIDNCQMLFVCSSEVNNIEKILSALDDRSVLTVSDVANFTDAGGMIGFVTTNDKIKLQINPDAAKRVGLNISSKLLRVAVISK